MKKQRLIFFTGEALGLLTHRKNLVERALKEGHEVHLITDASCYGRQLQKMGVHVHHLKHMKRGDINPVVNLLLLKEIYDLYKKIQPSLVHHVAQKPVLLGTLAARLAKVPAIVNALGGMGYMFSSSSLKAKFLRTFVYAMWLGILNTKKQRLIVQNSTDYDLMQPILPKKNLALIPGAGVDLNEYPYTPEPEPPIKIMMVARLLWDKGVEEFVKAAHCIRKRYPNVEFCIAGDIDPQNPQSLSEDDVLRLKKDGVVQFLGRKTNIAELYQTSHIAVLPSYREGMPKSLLEAAATGRPIVTTDVPGCRDIVDNGVHGFTVPAQAWRPLAESLKKLIGDKSLRIRLGKAAHKKALEVFSSPKIVNQTFAVYKDLIAPKKNLYKK